jgi:hypothetical protein
MQMSLKSLKLARLVPLAVHPLAIHPLAIHPLAVDHLEVDHLAVDPLAVDPLAVIRRVQLPMVKLATTMRTRTTKAMTIRTMRWTKRRTKKTPINCLVTGGTGHATCCVRGPMLSCHVLRTPLSSLSMPCGDVMMRPHAMIPHAMSPLCATLGQVL